MKPQNSAFLERFSSGPLYNAESRRFLSLVRGLLAAAALALAACAATPAPERPWSVSVTTSGGLTGRGVGAVALTSDGQLTITRPTSQRCVFQLDPPDVDRIGRLLSASRLQSWRSDYVPEDTCCDRILYHLSAETPAGPFETRWIDGPERMPRELADLAVALGPWGGNPESLAGRYAGRCKADGPGNS